MPLAPIFDRCFAPLIGRPCWQVKPGYGSFITLEFGEPHLDVREPIVARPGASPCVRKKLASRNVTVRGEWHLWIYCCNWTIFNADQSVASTDDDDFARRRRIATEFLDGQALTTWSVDSSTSTRLTFDLGGSLTTSPYDDDEQWILFQPDGKILTLRADRMYSLTDAEQSVEEWLPAWIP